MLVLTHASLATVDQLFEFKAAGFDLPPFPGYSADQWGIKAHNRPWIVANGMWSAEHRVLEVGGAYSRLPEWLATTYSVEAWIADDFGGTVDDELWSRWGDPRLLPAKFPSVKYVFERLGSFSPSLPSHYFDRILSVSTLEHIPQSTRLDVLRDMNRCTAHGGRQLHTIDIPVPAPWKCGISGSAELARMSGILARRYRGGIASWLELFRRSGVRINTRIPTSFELLDRQILVESPDVVYRFYPPNHSPKPYRPSASLLLVVDSIGDTP